MTSTLAGQLGKFGVWRGTTQASPELAAELERLGYGALWLGGSPAADLEIVDRLLDATTALTVGTSIVNMWQSDPVTVAHSYERIEDAFPGRFVLGVGAGHREATQEYASPYDTLARYVDRLEAARVPLERVVLAALGPRVLTLAADRTGGAIPYLVPPEHTRQARQILGPDKLLAPEHKVVLDPDPSAARELGGNRVRMPYLGLVNYTSNLRRLGYSDADLSGNGSDRLIDAVVAHGTAEQVAARLTGHLDAGADHVCVQLLTRSGTDPVAQYAELADALGLAAPLGA
ncbi:MAG TPA: LLM class F420-dependent oxidoreductase [Streptosporangiaceae bacterium]|nr:LLM class F420-dependent oxidoreductase [Streptosporangiaceae bacterium]